MARVIITRVLTYEYNDESGMAFPPHAPNLQAHVDRQIADWQVPPNGTRNCGPFLKITSTITNVEKVDARQLTLEFDRGINPVDLMGSNKGYTVDTTRAAIEDVCQPCQVGRCAIHAAPGRNFPSVGGHHQRQGMNDE